MFLFYFLTAEFLTVTVDRFARDFKMLCVVGLATHDISKAFGRVL